MWLAAAAAVLLRAPSLGWPLRPDEAGFLLVARTWHAQPDSVFGHYWVDRPPQVIALLGLTDQVGGPYFHRAVGALLCGLLVIAAAAAASELGRWEGLTDDIEIQRVSRWTAVLAAALVGNAEIDAVAVKGELLGIPLVMWSCWLILRAVRRHSWLAALLAGTAATVAEQVADLVVRWNEGMPTHDGYGPVGAVVGATVPEEARGLRRRMPGVVFLVPGYGAQGAGAAEARAAFDERGRGALVNSAREILYAWRRERPDVPGTLDDFAAAARRAALRMRDELAAALGRGRG